LTLTVTLIQGGGVGLDQAPAVQRVLRAAGVDITWDEHLASWASVERGRPPIPPALLESVRRTGRALKSQLLPPPGAEGIGQRKAGGNYNVQLRRELGGKATTTQMAEALVAALG
jgi:isocitrate/isopropylmalate dehydrogenase